MHPRRIIPGQKVHASVLFANAYKPRAILGEGFDIPVVHAKSADTELNQEIWDTGMFDNSAAKELVTYLGSQQGVAPMYLDRLLFMLRFSEFHFFDHPFFPFNTLPSRRRKGLCQAGPWLVGNF